MAYIRQSKTPYDTTEVQVCYKEHGKVVKTVHVGTAKSEKQLAKYLEEARKIINKNQASLFNLDKYKG